MALKRNTKTQSRNPVAKAVFIFLGIILTITIFLNLGLLLVLSQKPIADNIKWYIVQFLEENTGRHIEIGSVAPDFLRRLVVEDLLIGPSDEEGVDSELKNNQEQFIKVDRITIEYSLIKLLTSRGDYAKGLSKITLIKPEINLEFDEEQNSWNFSDMFVVNPQATSLQLPTNIPLVVKQGIVKFKGMPYMDDKQVFLSRKLNARAVIVEDNQVDVSINGEYALPVTGWDYVVWPQEWLPENKLHTAYYPVEGKLKLDLNSFDWQGQFYTRGVDPAEFNYWVLPSIGVNVLAGKVDAKTTVGMKSGYLEFAGEANLKGVQLTTYITPVPVTDISGTVTYNDQGIDNWDLSMKLDNTPFKSQGYTAGGWIDPRIYAEVTTSQGDLKLLEGYLTPMVYNRYMAIVSGLDSPQAKETTKVLNMDFSWLEKFALQGGFKGKATISGYLSQLSFGGEAEIVNSTISHPDIPVPLTMVNGLVDYKDGNISIASLDGNLSGGSFKIAGNIEDIFAIPYLNLKVDFNKVVLSPFSLAYSGLESTGEVSGKVSVGGFFNQPFATYSLEASQGKIASYNYDGLTATGRLANGVVEVESILAKALGADLIAKGAVSLPLNLQKLLYPQEDYHEESVMELDIKDIDIARIVKEIPQLSKVSPVALSPLEGEANISLLAKIKEGDLSQAEIVGNIEMPRLRYEDIKATQINGGFYMRDRRIGLERLQAEVDKAMVFVSGSLPLEKTEKLNVNVSVNALEPKNFAALYPELLDVNGRLDISVNVGGTFKTPLLNADIDWFEPGFKGVLFKRFTGKLRGDPQTMLATLSEAKLTSLNGASHEITGKILAKEILEGNIEVKVRDQELREILEPLGYSSYASGPVSADLSIQGTLFNPLLKLTFLKGPNQLFGLNAEKIAGTVSYQNNLLLVNDVKGELDKGSFTVFGHAKTNGNIDLQLSMNKIPLHSMPIPASYKEFLSAGLATFKGRVLGTVFVPEVRGEIILEDAIVKSQRFDRIGGIFSYANNQIAVTNSEIKWGQGLFAAKGNFNLVSQAVSAEITALRADLKKMGSLVGYSLPENIWANFEAKVNGTLQNPAIAIDLTRAVWGLPGIQPILTAKAKYENNILQITEASLVEGSSYIHLAGNYSKDGVISATLQGDNLELKNIKNALNLKPDISGRVNFKANLNGKLNNFKGQLELQASNVFYEQLQLKGLLGSFAIDSQGIKITEFRASVEGNELIVLGSIPWPQELEVFSNLPFVNDGKELPLKLSIRSPRGNLTSLNGIIPGLTFKKGQLKVNVDVAGSWQKPNFTGSISLTDSALNYSAYPDPISSLDGEILFTGNKAEIRNFSANIGEGRAKLSGLFYLDSINPEVSITYDLEKIPYKSDLVKTIITGKGRLAGTATAPRLSGNVILEDTEVNLAYYNLNASTQPPKTPLVLDLNVENKGEFRVKGMGLTAKGTGSVQVSGPLDNLGLDGRVEATEGTVNYLDNVFEIAKAQLVFQRYRGINPVISAEAMSRLPDAEIHVQVNGTIGDLRTTLSSNPPMSETDIIRKLTLHRFSNFAGGNIQEALTEELLRIVGNQLETNVLGDVENVMRQTFKLDEFRLEPNIMERTLKFKAGKYLYDNLYFTYSRTIEVKAKELMKLEYRFRPQTKLTASLDDKGEFRLGLEFNLGF